MSIEEFFIDDKFYHGVEDLLEEYEVDEPKELPEDFSVKIEGATLEPIFEISLDDIFEVLCYNNEERMPEDGLSERHEQQIMKALSECFDIEKFKSMIPELYYPNYQYTVITKQDLI